MSDKRKLLWQLGSMVIFFIALLTFWRIFQLPSIKTVPAYIKYSVPYNFNYPTHLLGANDYNLLLNCSFEFGLLNSGCTDRTLLLVLVHSSPDNHKKRKVIRETWGNRTFDGTIKIYFVIGKTFDWQGQKRLNEESQKYQDLIQANFLDTYRNLTYKHIASLKYAIYHCPLAKYVLKTDDDVFVNTPQMLQFLTVRLSPYGTSDLLFCTVKMAAKVLRTYRSKWRVAFEEYPHRRYPPYCPGWAIMYSPDVLFKLYKTAQSGPSKAFWIDDVYVTGILAVENNITHTDSQNMVITKRDEIKLIKQNQSPEKEFLFGRPDLAERKIRTMWRKTLLIC